jgi:hypothetical protein
MWILHSVTFHIRYFTTDVEILLWNVYFLVVANTVCRSLHWPECVIKACNHADTICQGLCQGLCQERILPGAKPLAGQFAMSRFAGDSAPGKTPGKRPIAKAFSILPGLLPLAKCNISCSDIARVYDTNSKTWTDLFNVRFTTVRTKL